MIAKNMPGKIGPTGLTILAAVADSPRPPSIAGLARLVKCTVNNVHDHLRRLKELKLVTWDLHNHRTLRATFTYEPR